jgi:hypothetical protein
MDYEIRGNFIWLSSAFTGGASEPAFANWAVVGETFVERPGDAEAGKCQLPG